MPSLDINLRMSKVKLLSQLIIEDYTYYVRDEVRKGRIEYKETGIDDDLFVYRELFLEILSLSLGLEDKEPDVNKVVKEELISLIKRDLSYRRFNKIALTNRTMIYKTCAIIFDKVVEGILGGDMIETK